MISLIAKSTPKQSGQLKKAGSHIIKNSIINVSKKIQHPIAREALK